MANLVLIRKKKIPVENRHAAVWKVAYADFVTAMMAFFILLWVINSASDEQLEGIGNFFEPSDATVPESAGSGGLFGGSQLTQESLIRIDSNLTDSEKQARVQSDFDNSSDFSGEFEEESSGDFGAVDIIDPNLALSSAAQYIKQAIAGLPPDQNERTDSLAVMVSPQGIHLELYALDRKPAFRVGSPELLPQAKKTLSLISQFITPLPNRISISGYSDTSGNRRSNWQLSVDRAISVKTFLVRLGLSPKRFISVNSYGDTRPVLAYDSAHPQNRRITITLVDQDYYEKYEKAVKFGAPPPFSR
jgi:chemotaxis protein MotB